MKGSTDRVIECTTAVFDGCMAMVQPDKSWVVRLDRAGLPHASQAKFQRVGAREQLRRG